MVSAPVWPPAKAGKEGTLKRLEIKEPGTRDATRSRAEAQRRAGAAEPEAREAGHPASYRARPIREARVRKRGLDPSVVRVS